MPKPKVSTFNVVSLPLRRAAIGASLASALLVTGWSVSVGARQAKPKAPQARATVPSPTGKAIPPTISPASAPADTAKSGTLVLEEMDLSEETGIGTGHKFKYTTADGDTVITGENGRVDKKKNIVDADTNLILDNPKHHITGDKSHVEMDKSRLVVNGNVVLTLKPEQNPANADPNASVGDAKKQGAVVTCDQIESFYKKKFNILRGHLVFKQHILRPGKPSLERTGTAEHAEYDGKKEILVLFPPVHGEDSDNQTFNSEKNQVIISTKSGKETIKGLFSVLSFPVKETDDDEPDTSPTPATSGAAKPDANPSEPKKTDDTKKPDEPKKTDDKSDGGKKDPTKPGTTR